MQNVPPPYSVNFSPERARALAHNGATLLLLDVPAGTIIGIDQQTFVVGPKFQGVKMLPPGPHMVSFNAAGGGDFAPTVSFFAHLAAQQVVVRRWDAAEELLLPMQDSDEENRYAAAVHRFDFDASLAPYNLVSYAHWHELSGLITPGVLERLAPVGGNTSVTAEADPSLTTPSTAAEARLSEQLQQRLGMQEAERPAAGSAPCSEEAQPPAATAAPPCAPPKTGHVGRCFYTWLPRNVKGLGLSPAELTALNLDKSGLLEQIISSQYGNDAYGIVGELQFAFLNFLLGQSLEAFGQWKALLHLMLACEEAPLRTRTPLYVCTLAAVRAQLQHCLSSSRGPEAQQPSPLGLPMTQELLADSFLKRLFVRFYDMLHAAGGHVKPQLQVEAKKLQHVLEEGLGWTFGVSEVGGDSDDEDAPAIVEL